MSHIKLYDTEKLVYTEFNGKCEYWVIRIEGVSPLPKKLKVRKKYISTAVAIFKDHEKGIEKVEIVDGNDAGYWDPNSVLESATYNEKSKAQTTEQ